MADLRRIQAEITELSSRDREALRDWLIAAYRKEWDQQMTRDFSIGGTGTKVLADIDEQIRCGNCRPME